MELRHIRYFCAVAELNGFSKAAARLHVSQSAISEQIRDLEEEIGVQLLVRSGRRVRTTPHGEVFLAGAREILSQADRAVEMAQRSSRGQTGHLSIGFLISPTVPFFPQIIREFRKRYPGVRLDMYEMNPLQQMKALAQGDIDIGFTRDLERPYSGILRSELVYTDSLMVALPRRHPLAQARIRLPALAEGPFLLYNRESWPGFFDSIIALCRKAGFSPHIANTALMQTVLTLVEAGEGIALVPGSVRHYGHKGLVFRPLDPEPEGVRLITAWRPDAESPQLTAFLDLVRERRPKIQQMMQAKV